MPKIEPVKLECGCIADGTLLLHTICMRCFKHCTCPKVKTARELREETDKLFNDMREMLDGLKRNLTRRTNPVEPASGEDVEDLPEMVDKR